MTATPPPPTPLHTKAARYLRALAVKREHEKLGAAIDAEVTSAEAALKAHREAE